MICSRSVCFVLGAFARTRSTLEVSGLVAAITDDNLMGLYVVTVFFFTFFVVTPGDLVGREDAGAGELAAELDGECGLFLGFCFFAVANFSF